MQHVKQTAAMLAMQTTLDIHDDVLHAAEDLARRMHQPVDRVVSQLLRQALDLAETPVTVTQAPPLFATLPSRGSVVTNELIDQLRDRAGV